MPASSLAVAFFGSLLEQTQLLLWLASIEEHVRRGSFCEHPQPPELRQIPQPPLLPPRFQDG
jgi:hypothetical protein